MAGFFTPAQVRSSQISATGKVLSCAACGLHQKARIVRDSPFGEGLKGIVNVFAYPIWHHGKNWVDYKEVYKKFGLDIERDCINMSAISCYPVQEGLTQQVPFCRKYILKHLGAGSWNTVLLHGMTAVHSVIGSRWKKDMGDIQKWRGWHIPDKVFKTFLCPVYSLQHLQSKDYPEVHSIWNYDMKSALQLQYRAEDFQHHENIRVIEKPGELKQWLDNLEGYEGIAAFDYETTGLKPHDDGHEVVCASIAIENECVVFTFENPHMKTQMARFLTMPLKRAAHNMKFEYAWSEVFFGVRTTFIHDSQLAAHVLDCRPNITSLKYQSYIHFGEAGYDEEVSPILKAKEKGGNSKNQILKAMKNPATKGKIMRYCAFDSIYELRLCLKQRKELYGINDT